MKRKLNVFCFLLRNHHGLRILDVTTSILLTDVVSTIVDATTDTAARTATTVRHMAIQVPPGRDSKKMIFEDMIIAIEISKDKEFPMMKVTRSWKIIQLLPPQQLLRIRVTLTCNKKYLERQSFSLRQSETPMNLFLEVYLKV